MEWFAKNDRTINVTEKDGVKISTIFIELSSPEGADQMFETMVFSSDDESLAYRYSTLDEARSGHDQVVDSLFNS